MALSNLRREFGLAVGAGSPLIRVNTDEVYDAIATIHAVCKKHMWELRVWDPTVGAEPYAVSTAVGVKKSNPAATSSSSSFLDAVSGGDAPIASLTGVLQQLYEAPAVPNTIVPGETLPAILVIKNFNLAFQSNRAEISSLLQHIATDKLEDTPSYEQDKAERYDPMQLLPDCDTGKFVVGLMPADTKLPPEVDPLFRIIDHELPDEVELMAILRDTWLPAEDEDDADVLVRQQVCRYAVGLTRLQAEGVFMTSLNLHENKVSPSFVWHEKSKILNKEGLVELYQGSETFADVAGLNGAKDLIRRLLTPDPLTDHDPNCRAKGAVFCGAPGTGKTLIAKAAGGEMKLPVLMVNPGNWMGGLVGESESKTRKGFQIVRAHAPCICVVDEVEKVMPSSRGHQGDSGVSGRMEGAFLTALNDIQERVFFVFTANDVRNVHEAFFRAERVDAVFVVLLPTAASRAVSWLLYAKMFFPKDREIDGKVIANPHYIPREFQPLLTELRKATKGAEASKLTEVAVRAWADKFTVPLMCLAPDDRTKATEQLKVVSPRVAEAVQLVNDDGWSPAEIRACCRLSMKLDEPLTTTQKRIRPVSVSAKKVIRALVEWASESALDAETGEVFAGASAQVGADGTVRERERETGGVRRKVRKVRED